MKRVEVEALRPRAESQLPALCHACREPASNTVTYANAFSKVILTLCEICTEKDYFKLVSSGPSSWVVTDASAY